MTASIFDNPNRAEEIAEAQKEWDERLKYASRSRAERVALGLIKTVREDDGRLRKKRKPK